MNERLRFEESTHTYTWDGEKVPSITDLVKIYGDDADEQLEMAMEIAADRGVTCHKILELLLSGETDIEYPSAYSAYVDAIHLFLSAHEIIPYAIEARIYSEGIGAPGTPDLLCLYDGVLTVVDYKFVAQVAKSKVKAQLNGYLKILNDNGVFPEQLIAVQFLNTGKPRPYDVAMDPHEFNLALEVYRIKNKKHPRGHID